MKNMFNVVFNLKHKKCLHVCMGGGRRVKESTWKSLGITDLTYN